MKSAQLRHSNAARGVTWLMMLDERLRDQTRLIDELTARLSRLEAKGAAAGR